MGLYKKFAAGFLSSERRPSLSASSKQSEASAPPTVRTHSPALAVSPTSFTALALSPKMPNRALGKLPQSLQKLISPQKANAHTDSQLPSTPTQPAKKRRKDSYHLTMSIDSVLNPTAPPSPPPTTPPKTPREWQPIATKAHTDQFRGPQLHILARCVNDNIYVNSSRRDRALPPTKKTRPALLPRRHSVDVITHNTDDSTRGLESSNQANTVDLKKADDFILSRHHETDEPMQFEPITPFPDPHRYRSLGRAGNYYDARRDVPPDNNATFLDLPGSSLTNSDFRTILCTSLPDGWFRDNVLDVALEILGMRLDIEAHGIAIGSSIVGQVLYYPGAEDEQDDYASYAEYTKMFEGKNWIFIPINDGYDEKDATETQGLHWSLIAVDRTKRTAHYVDSLFVHYRNYCNMAYIIARGLGRILGETYDFQVEYDSPHQQYNNAFKGQDVGPCGPFVVQMIRLYVEYIIGRRRAGCEETVTLHLDPHIRFTYVFHSWQVRLEIAQDMAKLRVNINADRHAAEHDAAVLADVGSSVEVIDELSLPLFSRESSASSENSANSATSTCSDDTEKVRELDKEVDGGVTLSPSREESIQSSREDEKHVTSGKEAKCHCISIGEEDEAVVEIKLSPVKELSDIVMRNDEGDEDDD